MDQIIDKLSEIEIAASRILDGAANQKKQLDQQSKDRIAAYDNDLETSTEKELTKLQDALSVQLDKELSQLKESAAATLESMDRYYEENHDTLSTQIYEKIIRK